MPAQFEDKLKCINFSNSVTRFRGNAYMKTTLSFSILSSLFIALRKCP